MDHTEDSFFLFLLFSVCEGTIQGLLRFDIARVNNLNLKTRENV